MSGQSLSGHRSALEQTHEVDLCPGKMYINETEENRSASHFTEIICSKRRGKAADVKRSDTCLVSFNCSRTFHQKSSAITRTEFTDNSS
jgi:hypothetical protein